MADATNKEEVPVKHPNRYAWAAAAILGLVVLTVGGSAVRQRLETGRTMMDGRNGTYQPAIDPERMRGNGY